MRIAILAQFPIHLLPGFERLGEPGKHYATWLPQLAQGFAKELQNTSDRIPESSSTGERAISNQEPRTKNTPFSIHWVVLTTEVTEVIRVNFLGQTFHLLPTSSSKRASTLFHADRAAITRTLDSLNPDLVHGWGNEDVYGLAASLSDRRSIVSIQGLLSEYILHNRMPARDYFQALIELFVIQRADHLVCESLWSADRTRNRAWNRNKQIHHLEYGVNEAFFESRWSPSGSPVAVFCGSADARKGIQDAVSAFSRPELAHAELRVLGACNTPLGECLKASSPPNVRWLGRVPIEETIKHLERAWCFVLPTRADTGPMALKEARVVGLPAICSPNSGARDYIRDGENGFLVQPGDVQTLADRLSFLLSDPDRCRRMGSIGHEQAREGFHPKNTAAGFLELYREITKTGG